jgi:aryl-alcohol dehydrogenase-like predicted oxidoreductase
MIQGSATPDATREYSRRYASRAVPEHFRELDGCQVSTIGIGTYLGPEDDATDAAYRDAIARAVTSGINVIDTAVNYRCQRSERAVGQALASLIAGGAVRREELVVATKGGFVPFDGTPPSHAGRYIAETYVGPGILDTADLVASAHAMTPRFLMDQLDRSRANLGLETIDVYYLHNPEIQLGEIARPKFMNRIRAAFAALEEAVRAGKIRRYGTATWTGYRQPASARDHLRLADLVRAARDVGGARHHFAVIQLPYSLAMLEAFTSHTQQVDNQLVAPLQAAERLGLSAMISASVHQGQLTRNLPLAIRALLPGLQTDAQRALQFVRSTPGVTSALVGMKSTTHVAENAGVAAVAPLPWEQFKRFFQEA